MRAIAKVGEGATVLLIFQRDEETRFNDVQYRYSLSLGCTQPVLFKIAPCFIVFQAVKQINVYIREI